MTCKQCSGQLGDNATFCSWCGVKVVRDSNNTVSSNSQNSNNQGNFDANNQGQHNPNGGGQNNSTNLNLTVGSTSNLGKPISQDDTGGCLWVFLGFLMTFGANLFVPLFGFLLPVLLYVGYKDTHPKRSKAIIYGMIAYIVFLVAVTIIFVGLIILIVVLGDPYVTIEPAAQDLLRR